MNGRRTERSVSPEGLDLRGIKPFAARIGFVRKDPLPAPGIDRPGLDLEQLGQVFTREQWCHWKSSSIGIPVWCAIRRADFAEKDFFPAKYREIIASDIPRSRASSRCFFIPRPCMYLLRAFPTCLLLILSLPLSKIYDRVASLSRTILPIDKINLLSCNLLLMSNLT